MDTPQWQIAQIGLVSANTYLNPYLEVEVEATFTGPDGVIITRPAFWDGGNTWRVRFAPTVPGVWRWATTCSDPGDGGLHGRTGALQCVLASGDNPNYRHGFLKVSDTGRSFVYADGTPFFWLGDTHWLMPDTERIDTCNHPEHHGAACPFGGQFQHLAADRQLRGFTVYQTYPSAASPAWWTTRYTEINPDRFSRVFDVQMDHLAAEGFVIALGCGHFNNSTKMPVADLRRWARYLVARYGAHPVVWITCQEMNAPEKDGEQNRIDVWRAVAEEIARVDGYHHPHSAHQWVLDVDKRPLGHEPWHTFFALQGGHRGSNFTPQARYAGYYAFQPVKPMIESEAMYEQVDCGGVATSDDARISAWKALLCGCAGYTYGAAGVWALKWDPADTRLSGYNHQIAGWYAGMALPGTQQMSVLKAFFLHAAWQSLTPRFSDPAWAAWEDAEHCVLATDGNRRYVAYCYGATAKGVLKQLDPAAHYAARWFDPRTGQYTIIETELQASNGQWTVPEKPEGDWVLVLECMKA